MADTAQFNIQLDASQTTGPANQASAALANLKGRIDADKASLTQLQSSMQRLRGATTPNIEAFKNINQRMGATKAIVQGAKVATAELGGSMAKVATAVDAGGTSLKDLASAAGAAGGPLGGVLGKASSLMGALGPAGLVGVAVAAAAAIIALGVAVAGLVAKMAMFALSSSNAATQQRIHIAGMIVATNISRQNMAALYGMAGAYGNAAREIKNADATALKMQASINSVSQRVALGTDEVAKYSEQLYKARVRGKDMEKALLVMSQVASVAGDESAQVFLQQVQTAKWLGGSIDSVIKRWDKFGELSARQMLSFDVISKKLRENFTRIFSTVKVSAFGAGLQKVLSVFSDTTVQGKALQKLVEVMFNPLFDVAGRLMGPIHDLFRGMIIGALLVTVSILKLRKLLNDTFGVGSIDIDTTTAAIYAGAAVVFVFVAALVVLGVALAAIGVALGIVALGALFFAAPFLIMGALIVASILIVVGVIGLLGYAFLAAYNYLSSLDFGAIGTAMMDGLVNGITSGAGAVMNAIQNLATSMKGAITGALGIASPSKVFAKFGEFTSVGMAEGIESGSGYVDAAVGNMVSIPAGGDGGASSVAGGAGRGGAITITLNISGVRDADQLRDQSFLDQLTEAISMGLMNGGSGPEPA